MLLGSLLSASLYYNLVREFTNLPDSEPVGRNALCDQNSPQTKSLILRQYHPLEAP